jgi:hypothetical protein
MLTRPMLAAATALAVAAIPAVASAATITVDKPCYSPGYLGGPQEKVGFTLAGFPAETPVQLNGGLGNVDLGFVTTGAAGGFLGSYNVDNLSKGRSTFSLTAATFDGTVSASTSYTVSATSVTMTPSVARPSTKVAFKARGFVGGKTLYAHYAYKRSEVSHPLVKTVRLGALTGPCGDLDVRKMKQLPLAKLKHRTVYEIQFDTSAAFHRQQGQYVARTVFVK